MKTVEEIALEVARDYLKFKLGDRKGFNVYDIDASDADELIAEIEQECAKSFMEFLAAVDAERWKAQLPVGFVDHGGIVYWHNKENKPPANDTQLFLSPTIPEGMALVPIEPTYDQCAAGHKAGRKLEGVAKLRASYKAMIQAAGVTK